MWQHQVEPKCSPTGLSKNVAKLADKQVRDKNVAKDDLEVVGDKQMGGNGQPRSVAELGNQTLIWLKMIK